MTRRTRRARPALRPLRGESPAAPPEPTQRDTGGDAPTPPPLARTGGLNPRIGQHLRDIASLHGRLARTYEDLAEEVGIALADVERLSVTAVVTQPATTTAPRADAMLNKKELADVLGCSARTVRRKELADELPASVGEGRLKRWRRRDIDRWLDGGAK